MPMMYRRALHPLSSNIRYITKTTFYTVRYRAFQLASPKTNSGEWRDTNVEKIDAMTEERLIEYPVGGEDRSLGLGTAAMNMRD
jgi:hypothetical protein